MTKKQEECVVAVAKAMGGKLDEKKVKEIVGEVWKRAQKSPEERVTAAQAKLAAKNLTEEELLRQKQILRDRMNNIMIDRAIDQEIASSGGKASKTIDRMNVGSVEGKFKDNNSLDARAILRESEWFNGVEHDLKQAGVFDDFTSSMVSDPELQKAVYIERARLNGADVNPTGNKTAAKMAEVMNKWDENSRIAENEAGANKQKRQGYTGRQTHDQLKIVRAGLDRKNTKGLDASQKIALARSNWVADVLQWVREDFGGEGPQKIQTLNELFMDFATGNHGDMPDSISAGYPFRGPGNLAKKLSESRVIVFKSPEAEFAYNQKYGSGTIFENFVSGLSKSARDVETLKQWGTNPMAQFQRTVEKQIEIAKQKGDVKEVARLETAINKRSFFTPSMQTNFRAATHLFENSGHPGVARFMAGLNAITSMDKLGFMIFSNFNDIATRMSALSRNGVNPLETLGDGVVAVLRGKGSEDRQLALGLARVGSTTIKGSTLSRFAAVDNVPGTLTRLMNRFMKWNMAERWQNAQMDGSAAKLMHNLATRSEEPFEAMHPQLRERLESYGITKEDWDVIRQSEKFDMDGDHVLTGEGIEDKAIRDKLALYYMGESRISMNAGGAAERAFVENFGPAGSAAGEMARLFFKFRTYSLTFARQQIYSRIVQKDYYGLAKLIVGSTIFGYLGMVAKDLVKGKTPRDPTDPSTWAAAFLQGGGAGIYGDFLFGQYDRFGNSLGATLAGPTVSMVSDWGAVLARIAVGGAQQVAHETGITVKGVVPAAPDWGQIGSGALRTTTNAIPFNNLFYTRVALDYLILYELQEAMNPGSLRRMEQKTKQNSGQTYMLPPSQSLPYHF